jgi:hypothetical protein
MNIKVTTLNYFRENRLTRDICPNVRTEDLVLCSLYRDPYQHLVSSVKVEYISTVTGQALLARLHVCDAAGDSPLLRTTEPGSPERLAAAKAASYPTP